MPSPASRTSYMATRDAGTLPDADDPLLAFAPAPHVAPRRNSITAPRQRAFIAHLAATGIVRQAALHIGASLEALYKLRHKPGAEQFSAAWDLAVDRGVARLEHCALARAIEGEERMVVSGGKVLGTEMRHNESLTMFFLRARRPERYGALQAGSLKPGDAEYERIRRQVLREDGGDDGAEEDRILASLDAKIDAWRARLVASAESGAESGDADGGDPERGDGDPPGPAG